LRICRRVHVFEDSAQTRFRLPSRYARTPRS
jgi:hypothetical protein